MVKVQQDPKQLKPTFEALVRALSDPTAQAWLTEWARQQDGPYQQHGATPGTARRMASGAILRMHRKAEKRIRILEAELSIEELEHRNAEAKVALLQRELWRTRQQLDEAEALAKSRQELIERLRSEVDTARRAQEFDRRDVLPPLPELEMKP